MCLYFWQHNNNTCIVLRTNTYVLLCNYSSYVKPLIYMNVIPIFVTIQIRSELTRGSTKQDLFQPKHDLKPLILLSLSLQRGGWPIKLVMAIFHTSSDRQLPLLWSKRAVFVNVRFIDSGQPAAPSYNGLPITFRGDASLVNELSRNTYDKWDSSIDSIHW